MDPVRSITYTRKQLVAALAYFLIVGLAAGAQQRTEKKTPGTFTDVTEKAGLGQTGTRFGSGCTFVDYDRDGYLDLFISRYIDLDLATIPVGGANRYCKYKDVPINCGPLGLTKDFCALYHNNGHGTFTEVTEKAGIRKPGGRYGLTAGEHL